MNWPSIDSNLQKVSAVAFSPDNLHLAVANDQASLNLYSLNHYLPTFWNILYYINN